MIIELFKKELSEIEFDGIAGIESRGFVFASVLSFIFKKKLILIRKKGKLPVRSFVKSMNLSMEKTNLKLTQQV